MRVVLISKYAATADSAIPSRQYFFAKKLSGRGHEVMLAYSRSNGSQHQKIRGRYSRTRDGSLEMVRFNGPLVTLGINVKRIWSWFLFEYRLFRSMRLFREFKPDVVLVSSLSFFTFLFGIHLKKKLRIPLVLEVRDIYPLTLVEVGGYSPRNPIIRIMGRLERNAYRNADLIISSLENASQHIERISGQPVPFVWLPMGFMNGLYREESDESTLALIDRIRELRKKSRFVVAYAGTLGEANALEEVMQLTQDEDIITKSISFVFIGDGPKRKQLEERYASVNVLFLGPVKKAFLPLLLENCDLLINTWLCRPIYRFGISPNKWIDYMYAARPILLALNHTSRIFTDSNCGWQVKAQDYELLKGELIRVAGLTAEALNEKGLCGKIYLLRELDYDRLTDKLENHLIQVVNGRNG